MAAVPHADIYERATNRFVDASLFKPLEPKVVDLTFRLAPLLVQELKSAEGTDGLRRDQFGRLSATNGLLACVASPPAVYFQAGSVQFNGKAHASFTYVWFYPAAADRVTNAAFRCQGIRLTLDSAGRPAVWEVLAEPSRTELIFVSQSLESAALAQFGKPRPGRRYASERSVEEAPEAVVARVIDDGAVPMGPIVYLSAGTRSVSTLICRCMAAQAKDLLATTTYELLPLPKDSTGLLVAQKKVPARSRTAFWPGDPPSENHLERCLRLPATF